MRWTAFLGIFIYGINANAQNPAARLWDELKTKRDNLAGAHQEFEFTNTQETAKARQSRAWRIAVDISQGRWRQSPIAGFNIPIRVFDGKDTFSFEDGQPEFVRTKRNPKDELPTPSPYKFDELDWSKAAAKERLPCGVQAQNHACVVLEIPIKPWIKPVPGSRPEQLTAGMVSVSMDTETGLLISSRTVESLVGGACTCQSEIQYVVQRQSYGSSASDASLFTLPSANSHEVKELPRWDAARVKKTLAGKPSPELVATDFEGTPISLDAFRGKTVLLDFWASWCPACRTDAPALQKLYERYGGKDLAIVGVSVNEDRQTVESFLKEYPVRFPVLVSTENEMSRPFQFHIIPTYVVIGPDGLVQGAVDGDTSFSDLRSLLKKAGFETK